MSVEFILDLLASGVSEAEILEGKELTLWKADYWKKL